MKQRKMSHKKAHGVKQEGTGHGWRVLLCFGSGGELYFWVNYMVKNATAAAGHPRSRENMYELWAVYESIENTVGLESDSTRFRCQG